MSARRKQLIALSVVLVCVIGMAAYGIVRVSNKTADKENGFDVAMTDTTDKSEDGSKDSDKTEKKEKTDQKSDAKKDDSVKEEDKKKTLPTLDLTKNEQKEIHPEEEQQLISKFFIFWEYRKYYNQWF